MNISLNGKDFNFDLMTIFLLVSIAVLAVLLYKAQKTDDKFDLRDLIIDKADGRVSLSRLGQFVALSVSTWGFITLTLHDRLTEWYYASYMMIWAAAEGFRKWGTIQLDKNKIAQNEVPNSTEETTESSEIAKP